MLICSHCNQVNGVTQDWLIRIIAEEQCSGVIKGAVWVVWCIYASSVCYCMLALLEKLSVPAQKRSQALLWTESAENLYFSHHPHLFTSQSDHLFLWHHRETQNTQHLWNLWKPEVWFQFYCYTSTQQHNCTTTLYTSTTIYNHTTTTQTRSALNSWSVV